MYKPNELTVQFMIWRYTWLPKHLNKTPVTHYKMVDYYVGVEPDGIGMIQCHRGLGKSQISMEFALFCICEGIEAYILFVGGTQDLTNDLVASASELALDVGNITVTRAVEGVLEIINKDGVPAYLVAKSTGSKLRGVAKGKLRQRPTAIILDDIVSDDLVMNRLRMDRANRWLTSALFPTLVPGGKVYGSGTPLHSSDPFVTLCRNFGSFNIPISETSFPDRFTPEYIERKKSQYMKLGQMRDWKREMELILTDDESKLFDMNKVRFEYEIPSGLTWFMTCDLAFSENDSADYSALICNGIDSNGNWHIYPIQGKWKPSETAGKIFELVSKFNILEVGIEQGSSFIAVKEHLDNLMLDYQTFFSVSELKHGGRSKISRISALEPVVSLNKLVIIDIDGETDSEDLVEQMELTDSNSCMAVHDDLLDSLSYQIMMELYHDGGQLPTREHYESRFRSTRRNPYD